MQTEAHPGSSIGDTKEPAEVLNPSGGLAISSASLFGKGNNEVVIAHQGEQYRLRRTRNGKLILTK